MKQSRSYTFFDDFLGAHSRRYNSRTMHFGFWDRTLRNNNIVRPDKLCLDIIYRVIDGIIRLRSSSCLYSLQQTLSAFESISTCRFLQAPGKLRMQLSQFVKARTVSSGPTGFSSSFFTNEHHIVSSIDPNTVLSQRVTIHSRHGPSTCYE